MTFFLKNLCISCCLVLFSASIVAQSNGCDQVYSWMVFGDEGGGKIAGERLYQPNLVTTFYTERGCTPAWYDSNTEFVRAEKLLRELKGVTTSTTDFHYTEAQSQYIDLATFYAPLGVFEYSELENLDILLTDAALQYALFILKKSGQAKNIGNAEQQGNFVLEKLKEALKKGDVIEMFDQLKVENLSSNNVGEEESEDVLDPVIEEDSEVVAPEKSEEKDTEETFDENKTTLIKDQKMYSFLDEVRAKGGIKVLDRSLMEQKRVQTFYQKQGYAAAWHNGSVASARVDELLNILQNASSEGLNPEDYHTTKLKAFLAELKAKNAQSMEYPNFLTQFDVLLTDAALTYATHLAKGKVDQQAAGINWEIAEDEHALAEGLSNALAAKNLASYFTNLLPDHPQYAQLKTALANYENRAASQEWIRVPDEAVLRLGDQNENVSILRQRLAQDYTIPQQANDVKKDSVFSTTPTDTILITETDTQAISIMVERFIEVKIDSFYNENIFDTALKQVVIQFQKEHALEADGIVGSDTYGAININPDQRIKQIKYNMERWRWLPKSLGDRYILVNIPLYELHVTEANNTVTVKKRVVVGKPKHETPVFSELMEYLDFNPYWTVPYSISTKEILPKLKRDVGYLARNNMKVFSGGKTVNPYTINWASVNASNFRYTIRQEPGNKNALGLVKFLFPNHYNVYVHDTPSRKLFYNTERAYSHGCIRLHEPFQLAEYLLENPQKYSAAKIQKIIDKGKNKRVFLPEPIPIYILYFTAWADENGTVRFLNDVYAKDGVVRRAMF